MISIGALVSGSGRSALHLAALCAKGTLPARVSVVIATRESVPAVERCRAAGLIVAIVPAGIGFDDRLDQVLRDHGVTLVCLCGYLRHFRVDGWIGRALNIHPALLPKHGGRWMYGMRVHSAVLDAGDLESGCTVHEVDAEYDHGTTIVQRRCAVLPTDTPELLAARVFEQELLAWPDAILQWSARRG
ncbi:MAG: formyltransferase family protein [Planctomycetota bacterium]|nr:formyltransferase family protein [Planctomycetota bacterium]